MSNYLGIEGEKGIKEGSWDSIHVVRVAFEQKKARYRVTSTVFLKMISTNEQYGDLEIAGNLTKMVTYIFLISILFNRKKRQCRWMQEVGMTSISQILGS